MKYKETCPFLFRKNKKTAPCVAGIGKAAAASTAGNMVQVVALCWVHSVIGFGFFILQSWVPTYLSYLGVTDLKTVGALSALPWLVSFSASAAAAAAVVADATVVAAAVAAVLCLFIMQSCCCCCCCSYSAWRVDSTAVVLQLCVGTLEAASRL